jgi:predicted ArsR family transcriptional regulator
MDPRSRFDPVTAVAVLAEPTRRRLYEYVVDQGRPVGRDEAAAALDLGRPLVAFHLDRLVEAGLLVTEYRRLGARSGPGAGRPAKLYARAPATVSVSFPERRYELAAALFATGVETGDVSAVAATARGRGRLMGIEARAKLAADASAEDVQAVWMDLLAAAGYEPVESGERTLLRNCPFDALVDEHRPLTCGMNFAMLDGMREGFDRRDIVPVAVDEPGFCCVAWRPGSAEEDAF